MSKLSKQSPHFLNKSHKEEFISKVRARMSGCNNPMFGRPVTSTNKKLISDLFSKSVYLYQANSLTLIAKYDKHKDLIDAIKISPKTLIKYKDSGKVFRNLYIISSTVLTGENQ